MKGRVTGRRPGAKRADNSPSQQIQPTRLSLLGHTPGYHPTHPRLEEGGSRHGPDPVPDSLDRVVTVVTTPAPSWTEGAVRVRANRFSTPDEDRGGYRDKHPFLGPSSPVPHGAQGLDHTPRPSSGSGGEGQGQGTNQGTGTTSAPTDTARQRNTSFEVQH